MNNFTFFEIFFCFSAKQKYMGSERMLWWLYICLPKSTNLLEIAENRKPYLADSVYLFFKFSLLCIYILFFTLAFS